MTYRKSRRPQKKLSKLIQMSIPAYDQDSVRRKGRVISELFDWAMEVNSKWIVLDIEHELQKIMKGMSK
jgi:hypothetical protein